MLVNVSSGIAQLTQTQSSTDVTMAGLRLNTSMAAVVTTNASASVVNGLSFDALGNLVIYDATSGMPANYTSNGGLLFDNNGSLIVSNGSVAGWNNGLPLTSTGALAVTALNGGFLQMEDGSYILMEDGSKLILE